MCSLLLFLRWLSINCQMLSMQPMMLAKTTTSGIVQQTMTWYMGMTRTWTMHYGPRARSFPLVSSTSMLAMNSSSWALRLGSLYWPTRRRRLWELSLKLSTQVQYNYSTTAIQEFLCCSLQKTCRLLAAVLKKNLYCSCIAFVWTAAIQHNFCVILL